MLSTKDLRALRELRVCRGADTRWVGVAHAAAWLHMDVTPLTKYLQCQGEKCGFGPFCSNGRAALKALQQAKDQRVATQAVAQLVHLVAVVTNETGTKRKAQGPPEV